MKEKLLAELDRLQKQYEKKMNAGAIIPPAIVQSACAGIAKRMDRIDAQLRGLS